MNKKFKNILYISIVLLISLTLLIYDASTIVDKGVEYNISLNNRIYLLLLLDIITGTTLAFLIINIRKIKDTY